MGFRITLGAHSRSRPYLTMFTLRYVRSSRNPVSDYGSITTLKYKCSKRRKVSLSLSFGFVIFGNGVKWGGVTCAEMNFGVVK